MWNRDFCKCERCEYEFPNIIEVYDIYERKTVKVCKSCLKKINDRNEEIVNKEIGKNGK